MAERQAKEAAARAKILSRAASLEEILEDKLTEEAKDIKELEAHLRKCKRSLRASINHMPPERRSRIENNLTPFSNTNTILECVLCHTSSMTPLRAVVPCGHQCLCDDCASTLSTGALALFASLPTLPWNHRKYTKDLCFWLLLIGSSQTKE